MLKNMLLISCSRHRTEEASKQLKALKEGFNIIFPIDELITLTWKDVEERVRGPSEISVNDLKSIANYSNCSPENPSY